MIFFYHFGYFPKITDHIDGNPSNNRIENLRDISQSANNINSQKTRGAVPYKGVYFCPIKRKYRAKIKKDNKRYSLGLHSTAEEAYQAYLNKREELFPGIVIVSN